MKRILMIEDDEQYQELIKTALEKVNLDVIIASDGQKAIELVKKHSFDLILLDLLLPKVDGVTFYHYLRSVLKMQTPVVVLTNVGDTTAYDPTIKDVLIKSNVSLADIVRKVQEYVR